MFMTPDYGTFLGLLICVVFVQINLNFYPFFKFVLQLFDIVITQK